MRRRTTAVLLLAVSCFHAPPLLAQCGTEETYLLDPTTQPDDQFGTAVALSGDVLVVGAIQTDGGYYGYYPEPGTVRVFRFDGVQWNHEQSFTNSNPIIGAEFGNAVATNGAWIVASAKFNHDRIWFFEWDGVSWVERQSFSGATGNYYGYRLAMDGPWTVAVDPVASVVDLYQLVNGQWSLAQQISGPSGIINVELDGTRLVTAQPGAPKGSQLSTWVYNGAVWVHEQDFGPSDSNADGGALFGWGIALSGDLIVVGMPWDSTGAPASGSVFIYRRVLGSWTLEEQLREPGGPGDLHWYGFRVATDGERVVALTPAYYVKQGVAWTYQREASNWKLEIGLHNENGYFDAFGAAAALDGKTLVVGGPASIARDGAVYLFPVTNLTLQVQPKLAPPGSVLAFITCKGVPGSPALLAAVAVNSAPVFVALTQGSFDPSGQWLFFTTVPPGLAGLVVTCATIGRAESGRVEFTNLQSIALQ